METAPDSTVTANAAIQTWTGAVIAAEIQTKALASVYRQWPFHKATRQPRLRTDAGHEMVVIIELINRFILTSSAPVEAAKSAGASEWSPLRWIFSGS